MTDEAEAYGAPTDKTVADPPAGARAAAPLGDKPEPDPRQLAASRNRVSNDVLNRVASLLKAHGRGEDANSIFAPLRAHAKGATASIVVVGEVSRGKSTLVNALIGRPGLSPVGDGETTAAYLTFRPADGDHPEGTAFLEYGDFSRSPIETDELVRWMTVGGSRSAASGGAANVDPTVERYPIGAEVYVEGTHLPEVVVIDTPGTGGLDQSHAIAAFNAAQNASILVLVTDAGGRLARGEVEFLGRCAGWVASIVVVVNKIDLHRRTWRTVLEENRKIIAGAGLGRVEVVGLSAHDALAYPSADSDDTRQRILERSGLAELLPVLRDLTGQADRLPSLNALRRCTALLNDLKATLQADLRSANGESGVDELELEVQRLTERIDAIDAAIEPWELQWGQLQFKLRAELNTTYKTFNRTFLEKFENRVFRLSAKEMQALVVDAETEVNNLCTAAHRTMIAEYTNLATELFQEAGLAMPPRVLDAIEAAGSSGMPGGLEARTEGIGRMPTASAANQAAGLVRTVAMVAGGSPIFFGSMLGAGIGGALLAVATAGVSTRKAQLEKLARELTEELRTAITMTQEQLTLHTRIVVAAEYRRELRRAKADVDSQRRAAVAARTASRLEQADRVKQVEHTLAMHAQLQAAVDRESTRLISD